MNMRFSAVISPEKYRETDIFKVHPRLNAAICGFAVRGDGHLYAKNNIPHDSSGYMFITFEALPQKRSIDRLGSEIVHICKKCGFAGIVLNGFKDMSADILITGLKRRGIENIFITGDMKSALTCCRIVSSAISGGTLRELLTKHVNEYGAENIALGAEFVRADFLLPALNGTGKELTLDETQALISKYRSPSFYSKDLETNYFSYKEGGNAHMVLFDNSRSIRGKAELALSLGITKCFIAYDETRHIIKNILS